ncbi:hypothetical protein LCGC14_2758110 [marine sediment metagenome]|uniref:Uncharacterized protein n=1 Tax=marine sediment metagenome TaxID=412755 RepID=A0A0F9BRG4_9ZZZZ
MSDLYAIRGPVYSRKSTIGLSIPGGKFVFDLERGVHRAKIEWPDDIMDTWVPPVDVSVLNHYRGDRVTGRREAWEEMTAKYVEALQRTDIQVIIFDTAKKLWTACHQGILQIKQEAQVETRMGKFKETKEQAVQYLEDNGEWRVQLLEIEYVAPNERMDNLIDLARSFDKELVFVNHERPVRGPTVVKGVVEMLPIPGKFELDGWRRTIQLADWEILTRIEESILDPRFPNNKTLQFYGLILKCPIGSKAVGKELMNLTMPGAINLAKALEAV